MVLADRRFQKKRNQLPRWIQQALPDSQVNLSIDQAVAAAKGFLKDMSVPWTPKMEEGISWWSREDLRRYHKKTEEEIALGAQQRQVNLNAGTIMQQLDRSEMAVDEGIDGEDLMAMDAE